MTDAKPAMSASAKARNALRLAESMLVEEGATTLEPLDPIRTALDQLDALSALPDAPPSKDVEGAALELFTALFTTALSYEQQQQWQKDADLIYRTLRSALRQPQHTQEDRPEIVCLCGSSRFIGTMAVLMWEFEKGGKVALGLHLVPEEYARREDGTVIEHHLAEEQGIAEKMDALHLRKIEMADWIYVVNVDGYIGDSTRREIAHATAIGKPVRYLEPPNPAEET